MSPAFWAECRLPPRPRHQHALAEQRPALEPRQLGAARHHRADDDQRGGLQAGRLHRLGQPGQRRLDGALARGAAPVDRRRGGVGRLAVPFVGFGVAVAMTLAMRVVGRGCRMVVVMTLVGGVGALPAGGERQGNQARRDERMTELVKAGKLPYTPPVMSWLSAKLDKPSRLITPEDVSRLLSGT